MMIRRMGLRRAIVVAAASLAGFTAASAAILALPGTNQAADGVDDTPAATATPPANETPTPIPATPTPTATATPTPTPSPAAGWETLQADLQAAVDGYWGEGRFAFAVTDLQTGYTASVNGQQHQLTGCIVNLFILVAAMQDVEAGRYDASVVDGLIDATIWSSNATTAYELYGIVGGGDPARGVDRVQAIFDSLGMTETRIDHPPAYSGDGELADIQPPPGVSSQALPDDTNNWTTAEDINRALTALYNGELLSPEGTADLLARLVNVKDGLNYLVAYVPGPAEVSHKNGFFPNTDGTWVDNDAGIVRVERDGVSYAYAVSFFSDSVVGKYADVPLGQELSRIAYEYFAAVYVE